jgi:AhpD family alkylhydroperoxidase
MTDNTRFSALTIETASDAARPMLKASASNFGFLPSPLAKAARSPALLKHLLAGFGAFERTSLSEVEREVVAFTVAFEMECDYCMAMHSAMLAHAPNVPAGFVDALRAGQPLADSKLEALHQFVRETVQKRGRVAEVRWRMLEAAGFTEEQALDVLLGVGVYLMSTLTNVVTKADIDPPFADFKWHKPG